MQPQGKVIAERQEDGSYLVLLPDGAVVASKDKTRVELLARRWFKKHVDPDQIGVGFIEWRE